MQDSFTFSSSPKLAAPKAEVSPPSRKQYLCTPQRHSSSPTSWPGRKKSGLQSYLLQDVPILSAKYPFLTKTQIRNKAVQLWTKLSEAEKKAFSSTPVKTSKKRQASSKSPGCSSKKRRTSSLSPSGRTGRQLSSPSVLHPVAFKSIQFLRTSNEKVQKNIYNMDSEEADVPFSSSGEEGSFLFCTPLDSKHYGGGNRMATKITHRVPEVIESSDAREAQAGILKEDNSLQTFLKIKKPVSSRVTFGQSDQTIISSPLSIDSPSDQETTTSQHHQNVTWSYRKEINSPRNSSTEKAAECLMPYEEDLDSDEERTCNLICRTAEDIPEDSQDDPDKLAQTETPESSKAPLVEEKQEDVTADTVDILIEERQADSEDGSSQSATTKRLDEDHNQNRQQTMNPTFKKPAIPKRQRAKKPLKKDNDEKATVAAVVEKTPAPLTTMGRFKTQQHSAEVVEDTTTPQMPLSLVMATLHQAVKVPHKMKRAEALASQNIEDTNTQPSSANKPKKKKARKSLINDQKEESVTSGEEKENLFIMKLDKSPKKETRSFVLEDKKQLTLYRYFTRSSPSKTSKLNNKFTKAIHQVTEQPKDQQKEQPKDDNPKPGTTIKTISKIKDNLSNSTADQQKEQPKDSSPNPDETTKHTSNLVNFPNSTAEQKKHSDPSPKPDKSLKTRKKTTKTESSKQNTGIPKSWDVRKSSPLLFLLGDELESLESLSELEDPGDSCHVSSQGAAMVDQAILRMRQLTAPSLICTDSCSSALSSPSWLSSDVSGIGELSRPGSPVTAVTSSTNYFSVLQPLISSDPDSSLTSAGSPSALSPSAPSPSDKSEQSLEPSPLDESAGPAVETNCPPATVCDEKDAGTDLPDVIPQRSVEQTTSDTQVPPRAAPQASNYSLLELFDDLSPEEKHQPSSNKRRRWLRRSARLGESSGSEPAACDEDSAFA